MQWQLLVIIRVLFCMMRSFLYWLFHFQQLSNRILWDSFELQLWKKKSRFIFFCKSKPPMLGLWFSVFIYLIYFSFWRHAKKKWNKKFRTQKMQIFCRPRISHLFTFNSSWTVNTRCMRKCSNLLTLFYIQQTDSKHRSPMKIYWEINKQRINFLLQIFFKRKFQEMLRIHWMNDQKFYWVSFFSFQNWPLNFFWCGEFNEIFVDRFFDLRLFIWK